MVETRTAETWSASSLPSWKTFTVALGKVVFDRGGWEGPEDEGQGFGLKSELGWTGLCQAEGFRRMIGNATAEG